MDINELANKLSMLRLYEWQEFSVPVKPADFHIEAATMLRQQQAEIEALKKELETCKTIVALSNIAWKNKFGDDQ